MSGTSSSGPPIRPAATVVLLRDATPAPELFMVQRHQASAFFGGAYVFPGGRVDDTDRGLAGVRWCEGIDHAAQSLPGVDGETAVAHYVAAVRELFEESGVLLARETSDQLISLSDPERHARFAGYRADLHHGRLTFGVMLEREEVRLALDALVPFAHWVTPAVDVRRFDAWFFLTCAPAHQTPAHDDRETTDSRWIDAATALRLATAGDIMLAPPTWTTLRELEPFRTSDEAFAWARQRRLLRREPRLLEQNGARMLLLAGDPEFPNTEEDDVAAETRFVLTGDRWLPVVAGAHDRPGGQNE